MWIISRKDRRNFSAVQLFIMLRICEYNFKRLSTVKVHLQRNIIYCYCLLSAIGRTLLVIWIHFCWPCPGNTRLKKSNFEAQWLIFKNINRIFRIAYSWKPPPLIWGVLILCFSMQNKSGMIWTKISVPYGTKQILYFWVLVYMIFMSCWTLFSDMSDKLVAFTFDFVLFFLSHFF